MAWGSKPKQTDSSTEDHQNWSDILDVQISNIHVSGIRRKLQSDKVDELAKSFEAIGQIAPIIVRQAKEEAKGFKLISGNHRLEAAKALDWKTIRAIKFSGKKTEAIMCEAAEDLHRAELTALEYDEKLAAWLRALGRPDLNIGQKVEKSTRGRPRGLAWAARNLAIRGKSEAARQKAGERAEKVASISPKAKERIRELGMDNSRSKMLLVAEEETPEAQVARIEELTASTKARKPTPVTMKRIRGRAAEKLSLDQSETFKSLKKAWRETDALVAIWKNSARAVQECFLAYLLKSGAESE
jgi:ParB/RepB/Spo0J family partition protein